MAQQTLYNTKRGLDIEAANISATSITTPSLTVNDGSVASVAFTVNAQAGDVITVNCQLNDASGAALAVRSTLMFFLSDDANGDSLAGTAPSDDIAGGTDGFIDVITTGKSFFGSCEADGDLDVTITEDGADTWYLVAVLPNGRRSISPAITFA